MSDTKQYVDASDISITATVIGLWTLYYTTVEPVLWGMASGLQHPFEILAKALIIVFAIQGAVAALLLALVVLAILYGVFVLISTIWGHLFGPDDEIIYPDEDQ